ncbi:MAG: hypothetical protein V1792_20745 [Pseudomonadota bacterium]
MNTPFAGEALEVIGLFRDKPMVSRIHQFSRRLNKKLDIDARFLLTELTS